MKKQRNKNENSETFFIKEMTVTPNNYSATTWGANGDRHTS